MRDQRDRPLDLVAEMIRTPTHTRAARLEKLAKPMLVRLADAAFEALRVEREARARERATREGAI